MDIPNRYRLSRTSYAGAQVWRCERYAESLGSPDAESRLIRGCGNPYHLSKRKTDQSGAMHVQMREPRIFLLSCVFHDASGRSTQSIDKSNGWRQSIGASFGSDVGF